MCDARQTRHDETTRKESTGIRDRCVRRQSSHCIVVGERRFDLILIQKTVGVEKKMSLNDASADDERRGLLDGADAAVSTTRGKPGGSVRAKRWRIALVAMTGAALIGAGTASARAKGRLAEPALGTEERSVSREVVDSRMRSMFGVSLRDFAEMVRGEGGGDAVEDEDEESALGRSRRGWRRGGGRSRSSHVAAETVREDVVNEYDDADDAKDTLELGESLATGPLVLPVYFHTEKSGGTSLVLHALELLNQDNTEVRGLIDRVRSEDVMLDDAFRRARALCPGSAMFLTTVWKTGSKWEPHHPRPLQDDTPENWSECRLLSSHTGRELLKRTEELESEYGVRRPKMLMGMFRDPAEYEQAAWRSEVFMYHDLRAELGWGKLVQTPLGSALTKEELTDFSPGSRFAKIMLEDHCKGGLDTNFQTKKLLEDQWPQIKNDHSAMMELAEKRLRELDWIGLTHRFDESACMLAYNLRKHPLPTSSSNYDRGKLLPETLRANHPHSGDHSEGSMDAELKEKLYECNDVDTMLFHMAESLFTQRKTEIENVLKSHMDSGKMLSPIRIGGAQELDPKPYYECLKNAATN